MATEGSAGADALEQYLQRAEKARVALNSSLVDPLSPETRRVRTHVLVTAFVALAITVGEVTPTRISFLGIEFDQADIRRISGLLALLLGYLLLSFCAHAGGDWVRWKSAVGPGLARYQVEITLALPLLVQMTLGDQPPPEGLKQRMEEVNRAMEEQGTSRQRWLGARSVLEFLFPVAVGLAGIAFLLAW